MCKQILINVCLILSLMLSSCIKSFYPEIENEDVVRFVVTGQVNQGDTVQYVNISTTAPISKFYHFSPVTGCAVYIIDDKGNTYDAIDIQDGNYKFYIPESKLTIGTSFKVDIYIPSVDFSKPEPIHFVSDYDQINECPDVDSVYYFLDSLPNPNPLAAIKGIRFCADLDAKNTDSHYFRFEATETWEYHATRAAQGSPQKVCWMTDRINDIFMLSTENLTENKYKRYPFHFVDNITSQRLGWGYSLLIRQYSLSKVAYKYWEKIRINSAEQGGLYGKQPLITIKGNMHNVAHPEQEILGFFGASSVKSKRIFVRKATNLPYLYVDCEIVAPPPPLDPMCFNCLLSGGTNIKPDFWPY